MAIFHWALQTLSRASGRSATAASAYRAATKVLDERTGEVHDYSRKSGVLASFLVVDGERVDNSVLSRERLWNGVEQAERRKDAKVARELVVAVPCELSKAEQEALVEGYAKGLSERTGWAVDVAIHAPGRGGDHRNVHAHLLCSTREVSLASDGSLRFGGKTRAWDVRQTGRELITGERKAWEAAVNRSLELAGYEQRVDGRSHKERGDGLEPQLHLGPSVSGMERRGIATERGNENRAIAAHNAKVVELSEVRRSKELELEWEAQKQRLETMPLSRLETQMKVYLAPDSIERLIEKHPQVEKARGNLLEARKSFNDTALAIEHLDEQLNRQQNAYSECRETKPLHAWLHDKGLLSSKALSSMETESKQLLEKKALITKTHQQAKQRFELFENRLEHEREQAMPWATAEQIKQQERHQEVQAIFERRCELELGLERDKGLDLGL